ncbi:SNARE domain [Seminavis robusta]|uniref:SNARE domain n=1 Tax=Seminavis robusta TaxID=568900 RepID=A0A9N8HSL7_9STRA|nr:SNARE domain [Seminavis robusta]|eukprot:Sro1180_g249790.1 SNARE domain (428) ;mRNA; r:31057-32340
MAITAVTNTANGGSSFSHAVSRSSELLSCAKTALKIGKAQHANDDDYGGSMWWACQEPNLLALCSWKNIIRNDTPLDTLTEDGLSLLRTMDAELKQLETLVRRRGHTNDPTEEIAASVRRLETDANELSSLVKTGFAAPYATAQYQRHTALIATWLESVATQQMAKLKEILKVRGNVLASQEERKKMLNPQGPAVNNSNSTATVVTTHTKTVAPKAMDTPLFTMSPLPKPLGTNTNYSNGAGSKTNNGTTNNTNNNGAYGGGYGGYGSNSGAYGSGTGSYYGTPGGPATSGMRQRRGNNNSKSNNNNGHYYANNNDEDQEEADKIQAQIQQRQNKRQTQNRLEEAQQAETKLASLMTMFSKMANLVVQQGEVVERVEDDVEEGLVEVIAGQQEITTLYDIKKGNRGLIIKVFALLIFFIIFMRFYKK